MARFRLLRGIHQQAGTPLADGTPTSETFVASDPKRNIVTSDKDLESQFGSDKFQNLDRMGGGGPGEEALQRRIAELEAENAKLRGEAEEEDLHAMTVAQLKALATEEGVELDSGMTKQEIINAIEQDRDAR